MRKIARCLRYWFGMQALFFLLVVLAAPFIMMNAAWSGKVEPDRLTRFWIDSIALLVLCAAAGTVLARAWWTLSKGTRAARKWAIAASLLNLPVLGLGTAAGILGLIAFTRPGVAAGIASPPARPRIPGDGTSRIVDFLALGAQVGMLLAGMRWWDAWGAHNGIAPLKETAWWLQFEIALLGSVLLHELGHVVGGWTSRMKLRGLMVGPFEWKIRNGKSQFKFNLSGLLGMGAAAMVPTSLRNLRGQKVFLILGGPVASLLTGCVGALAALTAPGHAWEPLFECLSMTSTLGFAGFLTNLIPVRPENQYSDGAHLYQVLSDGPWANVHIASSMVSATLVTPLRPRDLDRRAIARAANFLGRGKEAMLMRMYACICALDAGRIPEALGYFPAAEETGAGTPGTAHPEFVFISAFHRRDLAAARMWWERCESNPGRSFDADYWRARAALLWLEGRAGEAHTACETGLALARRLPRSGAYEYERQCFDQLREEMKKAEPGIEVLTEY